MPTKLIPKPLFHPTGRYLLNVNDRHDKETPTYIHDTENFKDECGIENIPTSSMSRFNSLEWALARKYSKCTHCFE